MCVCVCVCVRVCHPFSYVGYHLVELSGTCKGLRLCACIQTYAHACRQAQHIYIFIYIIYIYIYIYIYIWYPAILQHSSKHTVNVTFWDFAGGDEFFEVRNHLYSDTSVSGLNQTASEYSLLQISLLMVHFCYLTSTVSSSVLPISMCQDLFHCV